MHWLQFCRQVFPCRVGAAEGTRIMSHFVSSQKAALFVLRSVRFCDLPLTSFVH